MDTGLSALSSVTCNVEKWNRFGFDVDVVTLDLSWLEALTKVSIVMLLANCTCCTGASLFPIPEACELNTLTHMTSIRAEAHEECMSFSAAVDEDCLHVAF